MRRRRHLRFAWILQRGLARRCRKRAKKRRRRLPQSIWLPSSLRRRQLAQQSGWHDCEANLVALPAQRRALRSRRRIGVVAVCGVETCKAGDEPAATCKTATNRWRSHGVTEGGRLWQTLRSQLVASRAPVVAQCVLRQWCLVPRRASHSSLTPSPPQQPMSWPWQAFALPALLQRTGAQRWSNGKSYNK